MRNYLTLFILALLTFGFVGLASAQLVDRGPGLRPFDPDNGPDRNTCSHWNPCDSDDDDTTTDETDEDAEDTEGAEAASDEDSNVIPH